MKKVYRLFFLLFIFIFSFVNCFSVSKSVTLFDYIVSAGKTVKECVVSYLKCASLSFGIFYKDIDIIADDLINQLNITKDNISDFFNFDGKQISATESLINDSYKFLMQAAATSDGMYYWQGSRGVFNSSDLGVVVNSVVFVMDSQGYNAAYNFTGLSNTNSFISVYTFPEDNNKFYYADSTVSPLTVVSYDFISYSLSSAKVTETLFRCNEETDVLGWENPYFYLSNEFDVKYIYAWSGQEGGQPYVSEKGTYVRKPVSAFVSRTALENYLLKFNVGELPVDYDVEYNNPMPVLIDIDKLFNTNWDNIIDTIIKQIKKELKLFVDDEFINLDKDLYNQIINNYKTIINNNINNDKDVILPSDIVGIIGGDKNLLEQILAEIQGFKNMVSVKFTDLINSLDFQSSDNIINKSLNVVLEPIFNFQTYLQNFLTIKWDIVYQDVTQETLNIWNKVNIESNVYYNQLNNIFKTDVIVTPFDEEVKEVNNFQFSISLGDYGTLDFNLERYKDVFGYIRRILSIVLWVMYGYSVINRIRPKLNID